MPAWTRSGICCAMNELNIELFFRDNTMMLFGDAKKMTDEIIKGL
jgi:H+-translocating NAD(P) transhydrogenase subunit beta